MARERVEDDLGVGSARREEEELVLGDLRFAVIEGLTAQPEALGVGSPSSTATFGASHCGRGVFERALVKQASTPRSFTSVATAVES